MADEFVEKLGEIAVRFAWLEDLLSHCLRTFGGSVTRRMNFRLKCDRLQELLDLESDDQKYVARVKAWIKECREVAEDRNNALHSRHTFSEGRWQTLKEGPGWELTDFTVEQLVDISNRIANLLAQGHFYKGGERQRQINEDDARLDEWLEHDVDCDPDDEE